MERSQMIRRLEKKDKKNSLTKKVVTTIAIPLIIGSGLAYGLDRYLKGQEKEVAEAFSKNCGYKIVGLSDSENFGAQPYIIAEEQFQELKREFPKRFGKISNDEGISWLTKHYDGKKGRFQIPKYDCK